MKQALILSSNLAGGLVIISSHDVDDELWELAPLTEAKWRRRFRDGLCKYLLP